MCFVLCSCNLLFMHCFLFHILYIYIYYAHLASVRFEHSVCLGSLMTISIYIYIICCIFCVLLYKLYLVIIFYYFLLRIFTYCLELLRKLLIPSHDLVPLKTSCLAATIFIPSLAFSCTIHATLTTYV